MSIAELKVEIAKINSVENLREINRFTVACLNSKRESIGNEAKISLRVGSKVKLKAKHCNGRKGKQLLDKVGQIIKINPSNAKVEFDESRVWNIPYAMLEIL